MRNKPHMLELLLRKGAKLDLQTKNLLALQKCQEMSPELQHVIDEHLQWQRLKAFLKMHKHRDIAKHYPEAFKRLNKNLFN